MLRRITPLLVTAIAVTTLPGAAVAQPLSQASGEVVFECHAYVSSSPTPAGSGTCEDGVVPALAEVTISGLDDSGDAFLVDGVGAARASFSHAEACVANEPALIGTASGTATVVNVPAFHRGELTTASLYVTFSATVVGLKILITVTGWTVSFANGGSVTGTIGAGEATYIPFLSSNNVCPTGGPMEALVAGEVDLTR